MTVKESNLKKFLFTHYSENLYHVNKFLFDRGLLDTEPEKGIYQCPLCLRKFTIDDLDQLSPDHVPPQSVGGKDKDTILTCNTCNHTAGIAESRLTELIKLFNIFNDVPTEPLKIKFQIVYEENGVEKSTSFFPAKISNNGSLTTIEVTYIPPTEAAGLEELRKGNRKFKYTNFDYKGTSVEKGSLHHALLKIAYLTFFRKYGYYGILNKEMDNLRQQMATPGQNILQYNWAFDANHLSQPNLGIYAIQNEVNFRSILVLFELKIGKSKSIKFAVLLPLPQQMSKALMNIPVDLKNLGITGLPLLSSSLGGIPLPSMRAELNLPDGSLFLEELYKQLYERFQ